MKRQLWAALLVIAMMLGLLSESTNARTRVEVHSGGKGAVTLPYRLGNVNGNEWIVYQGGWLRGQQNMPVFNQGAMPSIDGNQLSQNNNGARIDDNGDLIIELQGQNNVTVTRRIGINKDLGFVRIVDIVKNPTAQQMDCQYDLANQMCYGMQASHPLTAKYKDKEVQTGVIVQDGQNRQVMGIFAGKSGKVQPVISADQNNNNMDSQVALSIPPNKEVAVMSVLAFPGSVDAGEKLAESLKEGKLMSDLPRIIRKMLVNFSPSRSVVGGVYGVMLGDDMELLRGDLFDAVELRGGDQYKGTLDLKSIRLETNYGPVSLPADRILTIFNIGDVHPRQLVVLDDGSCFGGKAQLDKVSLQLTSGQNINLPMSQITRLGFHVRGNEDAQDDWNMEQPMIFLRGGDRFPVGLLAHDVNVATRYGVLALKPQMVASISFANEETGVHEFTLVDGSKFAGLLVGDSLEVNVPDIAALGAATRAAGEATTQPATQMGPQHAVKFSVNDLARVQFQSFTEPDETVPMLKLTNDDRLAGTLTGVVKLDTPFNTLSLKGEQIKQLKPGHNSPLDAQVRLWDDSQVSGQLEADDLTCQLGCGLSVKASLSLIDLYDRAYPEPSEQILQRVKQTVADLDSEDFKVRERAEAQLTAMGSVVVGVLRDLVDKPGISAQANNSMRAIINSAKAKASNSAPAAAPAAPVPVPMQDNEGPVNQQQLDIRE